MNRAPVHRQDLAAFDAELAELYWADHDVADLLRRRTEFMDDLLRTLWRTHIPASAADLALLAVGGYGRGELLPHSDIDLLIVGRRPARYREAIESFWHAVFDLNVEVGHSVRALRDCRSEAAADITVATAMFERRALAGSEATVRKLDKVLSSRRLWPAKAFFKAKLDEQKARHRQFANVEYGLEPNIKESPGGLRDLHTAMWVFSRQFGTDDPRALEELGLLTPEERTWLENGRRYLWWIRWGLHLIAGRKEERLQFEYQRTLAQRHGYVDTDARLGVERFMHQYYRHILTLREVNDILLQVFDEQILRARERPKIEPVNERFQIRNDYMEITAPEIFESQPSALLEIFVIMANRRDVSGVRAETIRAIRGSLHLIDNNFRRDPACTELFMALLKAPYTLVSQLTRMRRYGVLGRYLPEFGEIIGQMQHDLFHVYTVDAHTMEVIRNMRRFHYRSAAETFPVAAHSVKHLPKIELLYVAGLYHDIGKGRGGDHSAIGAGYVREFAERHGLSEADTELAAWLVNRHLLMSSVAQRQDIHDPDVINQFAREVKSEMRLDYLYTLTVADINATNPTLWNSWRATLLRTLYGETRKTLRRGLEDPINRASSIAACQERARERLLEEGFTDADVDAIWSLLSDGAFLRHSPRQIAELTRAVHGHDLAAGPMVLVRDLPSQVDGEGATEIFLYARDQPNLFAASVIAIGQLQLSVLEANIETSQAGLCLNRYVVLEPDGTAVNGDSSRRAAIRTSLIRSLTEPETRPQSSPKRIPRRVKQLARPAAVTLQTPTGAADSTLTVLATDRPGLLAEIGLFFVECHVSVNDARITTLGDRVEDVFHITDPSGRPFEDPERIYELENGLRQLLDRAL